MLPLTGSLPELLVAGPVLPRPGTERLGARSDLQTPLALVLPCSHLLPGVVLYGPQAEAAMNRSQTAAVGLGLTILAACATTTAPGVTRASSAALTQCLDERAACVSNEDCCNANCFYGVCERPEQE
jgi:hypothetical protein